MAILRFTSIVLLSIVAAILYGIIHDQITARICVEYFTIGHPPVFETDDPALLGLGWGVIATWWVGLSVGVPLAAAAQLGAWPKRSARQLVRPLTIMLLMVGGVAAASGIVGHVAASHHWVHLVEPMYWYVPRDRHVAFLTDLWIHLASYIGGGVGGVALCVWALVRRAPDPRLGTSAVTRGVSEDGT